MRDSEVTFCNQPGCIGAPLELGGPCQAHKDLFDKYVEQGRDD